MLPVKVFISYSHEDKQFKEKLELWLEPYKKELIELWTDSEILPGEFYDKKIINKLENADVIIFLVSTAFLGSNYITNIELKRAITLHESGHSNVIPVIVRKCIWEDQLGKIQVLPTNRKAINNWDNEDDAFHDVTTGLLKVFKEQQIIEEKRKIENLIPKYDVELGNATSNIFPAATSIFQTKGIVRRFEKGSIYKITEKEYPRNNRIEISDYNPVKINNSCIGICYEMRGGTNSELGFPLSDLNNKKESEYGKGLIQRFEGGSIYYKEKYGARLLLDGNISKKFVSFETWLKENKNKNWIGGILGFPVTNEEKAMSKFKS